MSSELRVLTIDYSSGHTENILFSIADIKQAGRILEELPSLVEHGSWDIITITDSRLAQVDSEPGSKPWDERIKTLARDHLRQANEIGDLKRQLHKWHAFEDEIRPLIKWSGSESLFAETPKEITKSLLEEAKSKRSGS